MYANNLKNGILGIQSLSVKCLKLIIPVQTFVSSESPGSCRRSPDGVGPAMGVTQGHGGSRGAPLLSRVVAKRGKALPACQAL